MHCITCDKDCPMKYEKYMDVQTPCLVCARRTEMPTKKCWECARGKCHFIDMDAGRVEQIEFEIM